jgi:hypothetical protein
MLSFQDFFRQRLALLALPALTFAALWAALTLFNGSSSPSGPPALDSRAAVREGTLPGATTDQRIEALQAGVRSAPADPEGYGELGLTYLQKVRETGDPSFYPKAEGVFRSRWLDMTFTTRSSSVSAPDAPTRRSHAITA